MRRWRYWSFMAQEATCAALGAALLEPSYRGVVIGFVAAMMIIGTAVEFELIK